MIIDKKVKVKIGGLNVKYFRSINPEYRMYQEIEVSIEDLPIGSNVKINCLCDICGEKRFITYQKYRDSENLYGEYTCQKCSHKKRKKTCIDKYGVDNYMASDDFKKKYKEIIFEKYGGVENIFQSDIIKDRIKERNLEKYGVEYLSQTDIFREKSKQTCLNKYGVEYYYQSEDFKLKSEYTKIERYGDVNFVNVSKMKETKVKKGTMVSDEDLTEWELYKRIVWRLTNKNRNKIFEQWNGLDYYDGEHIDKKDLNKYDNTYPTIDHKISVFFGFKNGITAEEIAKIENLCITKRIINITKNIKNEDDYKRI
jgi:hypothetical protein